MNKKYVVQLENDILILSEEEILKLCESRFKEIKTVFELGSEFEVVFKLIKKSEAKPDKKGKEEKKEIE